MDEKERSEDENQGKKYNSLLCEEERNAHAHYGQCAKQTESEFVSSFNFIWRRLILIWPALANSEIVGIFTFVLCVVTAALAYIAWLQYCTLEKTDGTLNRQIDANAVTQQPWISIDPGTPIQITQPLEFNKAGAIIGISYLMRNTGMSPALRVRSIGKIVPVTLTGSIESIINPRRDALCADLIRLDYQPVKISVFPNDKIPGHDTGTISANDVADNIKFQENAPKEFRGKIMLGFVNCIVYETPLGKLHYTAYSWALGVPNPSGAVISSINPEGVFNNTVMIYIGQNAQ